MRTSSFGLASLGMLLAMAAACSGQSPSASGAAGSGSSPAAAPAPAVLPERNMIVLLRDQLTELNVDRSTARRRAAAIATSHAPFVAELQARQTRVVHSFETVNGFAARLSQDEIDTFTAKPQILAVVPDRAIPKPRRASPVGAPGNPRGVLGGGTTANVASLCNTLEPEALQITNTAFLDASTPQAQNVLDGRGQPVTGKGVTVAVIADGLDPSIPGFIRPDGSKVFVDYQNFSGDPAGTPTSGGEIFGDASSVAAQDMPNGKPLLYDISQFAFASLPSPCNIRIRGMAPGASLVGIDIFSDLSYSPLSVAVQAIDWAVVHDQVDVINESFGENYVADTSTDPLSLANAAAVQAGVTLTVASGDAGSAGTFGSPATDPNVIAAGASTQLRFYAQTGFAPFSLAAGYVDDNVSSFSSGGFAESRPRMVDVLAPGDASWALCSTDEALFNDCATFNGAPSPIEFFGGTSEAAPLTAGEAALVIQAYRSTHGGQSPSPALVKALIMSTATDLGAPAAEQGAGRIDALAAVNAALAVRTQDGGPPPRGTEIVATPSAAVLSARPGDTVQTTFQITNTGTTAQHLRPALQRLGAPFAGQTIPVTLGTSPTASQTFAVPAGADHLDVSIAFPPSSFEALWLLDPQGRLVGYSYPQGGGSGYGSFDVVKPTAGTWTAIVNGDPGLTQLTWAAEDYVALGSVSPSRLDLAPGASATLTATFQAPSQPGDLSAAVRFPGSALSDIPVGVRIAVPLGPKGGSFSGTLTGGNGRQGALPTQIYAFDVPSGVNDLALTLSVPDSGYGLAGFLVDPNGSVLDSASNTANLGQGETALELLRAAPQAGAWKLLLQENQASGNETSIQFSASIAFDAAEVSAPSLPNSKHGSVSATQGATVAVSVTNTGAVTKAYFADARLSSLTSQVLPIEAGCAPTLPGYCGATPVPTRVAALELQAQAGAPITMDASPFAGGFQYPEDPDVWAVPVGRGTVAALLVLPEIPYGPWLISPALMGPFGAAGAPQVPVTTTATAVMQAFDPSITASTGDYWTDMTLGTTTFQPLVLAPGATGTITLTIQPAAASVGTTVAGLIYVDAANPGDVWSAGDEIVALPYAYTVGH
jgi:hypothetical protein